MDSPANTLKLGRIAGFIFLWSAPYFIRKARQANDPEERLSWYILSSSKLQARVGMSPVRKLSVVPGVSKGGQSSAVAGTAYRKEDRRLPE